VQKHRIETLSKNRDALEKELSFFVLARWCTNSATKIRQKAWCKSKEPRFLTIFAVIVVNFEKITMTLSRKWLQRHHTQTWNRGHCIQKLVTIVLH